MIAHFRKGISTNGIFTNGHVDWCVRNRDRLGAPHGSAQVYEKHTLDEATQPDHSGLTVRHR